jgi:acyl carrier protein
VSEARDSIREYLALHSDCPVEEIDASRSLFDDGILDSLGLLELTSFLGERFGIVLQTSDVVADNFKTVETIVSLVDAKLGAPG